MCMEFVLIVQYYRNGQDIEVICMMVTYLCYISVGQLKIINAWTQKSKLNGLVNEMEAIFPAGIREQQDKYQVDYYFKRVRYFMRLFSDLLLMLFVVYSVYNFVYYQVQRFVLHTPNTEKPLPYYSTCPWDCLDHWSYYLIYTSQIWCGIVTAAGHIATDLSIYGFTMQLVMHFDYISKTLIEYQVQSGRVENGHAKDIQQLKGLIIYHHNLFGLSDVMNSMFELPVLLNFATSTVWVCIVAFQMTLGLSAGQTLKLIVAMTSALTEIYIICYFSDLLIVSSEGVCSAAYEIDWSYADVRFSKMLIIIAQRAQKPVCIKATKYLNISMETMAMFLKISYRLFCIIRTMYQ
ncbi:odorant receptor 67a-like [Drosophila grimshawi]|uniref:odorant receptor 67a-like n=1 Tax=Drosophila grimshawi TaxID=7222 RepID=UPI001C9320CB|nr:odorant receptor 67a-like [Drosophila grimshawi]